MPRLTSFWKSSKKNANKENVPSNIVASDLARHSPEIYTGERQQPPRVSPYDVVSAPKVSRPTRSWAGGPSYNHRDGDAQNRCETSINVKPFTHRQSNGNSSQRHYENLQRNTQPRITGPKSNKLYISRRNPILRNGSLEANSDYYDDCVESDEDDLCEENEMLKQKVHYLENELSKIKHDYGELKITARNYEKDWNYYSRELDKEMSHRRKLSRKLKDANYRVMELEKVIYNDRMSFMGFCNINSQMQGSVGAGEALCVSEPVDSRELNADTPSVMFVGGVEQDDSDEVRVYRQVDVPDGEISRNDLSSNHCNLAQDKSNDFIYPVQIQPSRLNRSMSDTDVYMTSDEPSEENHCTSSWDRGTVRYSKNKPKYRVESEATSDTSSEDGHAAECYRQLKKKGDIVVYKPPRRPIHEKYYRKCGKGERSALASLDFLHDFSSDYSQLQSSPDVNRHVQYQIRQSRKT